MALPSSGEQPNSEEARFARGAPVAVVVLLALALCFVLALINTFIHHEQQHHQTFYGTNKYIVVTLAEVIKLTCCICVYLVTTRKATPPDGSNPGSRYGLTTVVRYTGFKEALAYCVPAVVYLIENNSIFVALDLLDSSATFQLLLNIKIVITALLFRYFLGRSLSMTQFICTVLCAVGLCIAVVASGTEEGQRNDVDNPETGGSSRWVRTMLGAGLVFTIALVSSFSNIWVEIYMWGAPLNSVAVMAAAAVTGEMPTVEALRAGLVTAVGLSVVGLATAVILNYGNNMVNAYLHAGTLICTASPIRFPRASCSTTVVFSPPTIPPFAQTAVVPQQPGGQPYDLDDDSPREVPVSARLVGSRVVSIGAAPVAPNTGKTEAVVPAVSRGSSVASWGVARSHSQQTLPSRQSVRVSASSSSFFPGSKNGGDPVDRILSSTEVKEALLKSASARGSVMRSGPRGNFARPTISSANRSFSAKALLMKVDEKAKSDALRGERSLV
ncbi:hypothetical protein FOZ60_014443 [Perkinsus olseni]|uniref:Uncharacterized protein n=1 Tax=Perkinsus olseni TaxID=32597 RepID=A0A7J6P875_PEROL|nr:hypothetical protein FOZ60_014443 [Perkinsus olseni]